MGLIQNIRSYITRSGTQEDLLLRNAMSGIVTKITEKEAFEIPAFSAAVDFIASTVAMLPVKLYKEDGAGHTEEMTEDSRLTVLNDESGDTLNTFEIKKAIVTDMLIYGAGYVYIERKRNIVKSLRYVSCGDVSVLKGVDPIFKIVDLSVMGRKYNTWDFITLTRKTRDGASGKGIIDEHNTLLSAAYNMLRLENNMVVSGGGKKGFLQSDRKLAQPELDKLKEAWNQLYCNPDNRAMVLNDGVKFQEGSNSAVDLQLNQNKVTNSQQIALIFGLSPDVISGKASAETYMSSIKTGVLPVVQALQTAINRSLLLESEKQSMYFAIDTAELLKGDIRSRYEAYRIGLEANFLQPDEIRYKEDLPPLGLDFIKLGLNDVLYDTKTKTFYTPNTNQHATITGNTLQNEENRVIMQLRQYIQDPKTGQMMGSIGEGGNGKIKSITVNDDGTITTVYKQPEKVENPHTGNKTIDGVTYDSNGKRFKHREIQLNVKEYLNVRSSINTVYESKYKGKQNCVFYSSDNAYLFENHGFDSYCIYDKI